MSRLSSESQVSGTYWESFRASLTLNGVIRYYVLVMEPSKLVTMCQQLQKSPQTTDSDVKSVCEWILSELRNWSISWVEGPVGPTVQPVLASTTNPEREPLRTCTPGMELLGNHQATLSQSSMFLPKQPSFPWCTAVLCATQAPGLLCDVRGDCSLVKFWCSS